MTGALVMTSKRGCLSSREPALISPCSCLPVPVVRQAFRAC